MPRTAALLYIHNEAQRLPWWMAHHLALGFSALLVCDDHSTDGSRELLTQAARHYDIRIIETDTQDTDALHRREAGLNSLIQREHEHFDWMLPLAIDEYFLPTQATLSAFLADIEQHMGTEAFLHTTSIPVNWCIMGLGGTGAQQWDGPTPHPRALFTTHAAEDFPDHRITRDFFRPTAQQTLPDPFARLQTPPDWSQARILHDAAANSRTPQARRYFDRNDHRISEGQRYLPQSMAIAAQFLQGLILSACYTLQNQDGLETPAPSSHAHKQPSFKRSHVRHGDSTLALHKGHRKLGFYDAEALQLDEQLTPLRLLQLAESPNIGWLYTEVPSSTSYLPICAPHALHVTNLLDCLPIHITSQKESIQLKLLPTGQIIPENAPLPLTLYTLPDQAAPDTMEASFHQFLAKGFTVDGVKSTIRRSRWLSPSVIGAIYAHLPEEEAHGLFSPILYQLFHSGKR